MSGTQRKAIVVAIDGPAGAGKSTVSKRLTAELGYRLLDTGALYRAVALVARQRGVSWEDGSGLAEIAAGLDVRFELEGMENRVFLGGQEVSQAIRTPEISNGASVVSALPEVRSALLELQRRLGSEGGVVAEGRDVGSVVFPSAAAKFYLTASAEVRARRRHEELRASGSEASLEETLNGIVERDERDSGRAHAPLTRPEDAVLVDSSERAIDDVVAEMLRVVREREAR